MSTESGPKSGWMNRREFLKAGAAAVGLMNGGVVEGQERQEPIDNSLLLIIEKARQEKLNFPDKFEPVSEEVKSILFAIQQYQDAVDPNSSEAKAYKQIVWEEIKKIAPNLGKYSDTEFCKAYAYILPSYFAKFGICMYPSASLNAKLEKGVLVSFLGVTFKISALQISGVEHQEVTQDGVKLKRDILHGSGLVAINGSNVVDKDTGVRSALEAFQNVVVFDEALQAEFQHSLQAIRAAKKQLPDKKARQSYEKLQRDNSWDSAAETAVHRIINRVPEPSYEEYRNATIAHETRHVIDAQSVDLNEAMPTQITKDPSEHLQRMWNISIHQEINPMLSQLKSFTHQGLLLQSFLDESMPGRGHNPLQYKGASIWILKKMIELISKEPNKYGIKIEGGNISTQNQIVSQLDVLVDKPELVNELCDQIILIHNQNLSEDIYSQVNLPIQIPGLENRHEQSSPIRKILFTTGLAGGAVLGFEALRRQKNKVAKENMARQARKDARKRKK